MFFSLKPKEIPSAEEALAGREQPMSFEPTHFVSSHSMVGPFPEQMQTIYFGMGCFWGAERLFWRLEGIWVTAAGYQGGSTPNPTYDEVCSGRTGHTEAVMVVFDPNKISLAEILKIFWEEHDPTQGMRQGNDVGTQYRSAIYATSQAQLDEVLASKDMYAKALSRQVSSKITTEIALAAPFYFAETYHQQYLAKNPNGYCGLKGTGVSCPLPNAV